MTYRTIVADPPWTPRGSERSNAKLYARVGYKGYPQRFYSTLSVVVESDALRLFEHVTLAARFGEESKATEGTL